MVITPATLDAAFLAFDTRFQEVFKATPIRWSEFASRVPSATKEQRHAWLKRLPELREWLGERQLNNLSVNMQTLVNKKYEGSFSVDRTDIEDDILGVYMPAVEELASASAKWPDRICTDALVAGSAAASLCHDGQPFFSASHPINPDDAASATQSNYYTGGSAKALTPTNYDTVRQAMRVLKGEDGVPLEIEPQTLIVPPQLETTAKQIVEAEILAAAFGAVAATGSSTNVLKGTARVVVLPRLASDGTTWYLADTSRAIKPLIFQDRMAPEFTYLNRPDDANVFSTDKFIMGVRSRGAAGYGPYYLISKCKAS